MMRLAEDINMHFSVILFMYLIYIIALMKLCPVFFFLEWRIYQLVRPIKFP